MTPWLLGLVLLLQAGLVVVEVLRWFRVKKLEIRVYEHDHALLNLARDLDLAGVPHTPVPIATPADSPERRRQSAYGIAPPPAWIGPPLDETIATSAKLPADDPGDRDQMEVEVEDARPLSPIPPER